MSLQLVRNTSIILVILAHISAILAIYNLRQDKFKKVFVYCFIGLILCVIGLTVIYEYADKLFR